MTIITTADVVRRALATIQRVQAITPATTGAASLIGIETVTISTIDDTARAARLSNVGETSAFSIDLSARVDGAPASVYVAYADLAAALRDLDTMKVAIVIDDDKGTVTISEGFSTRSIPTMPAPAPFLTVADSAPSIDLAEPGLPALTTVVGAAERLPGSNDASGYVVLTAEVDLVYAAASRPGVAAGARLDLSWSTGLADGDAVTVFIDSLTLRNLAEIDGRTAHSALRFSDIAVETADGDVMRPYRIDSGTWTYTALSPLAVDGWESFVNRIEAIGDDAPIDCRGYVEAVVSGVLDALDDADPGTRSVLLDWHPVSTTLTITEANAPYGHDPAQGFASCADLMPCGSMMPAPVAVSPRVLRALLAEIDDCTLVTFLWGSDDREPSRYLLRMEHPHGSATVEVVPTPVLVSL